VEDDPGRVLHAALVAAEVVAGHGHVLHAGHAHGPQVTKNLKQGLLAVAPQDMMTTVGEVSHLHSRDVLAHVHK